MKDPVPKVTLRIAIISLLVIAAILFFLNQPNAVLALIAVIALSIIYLGGMEKNHETFMKHRKRG